MPPESKTEAAESPELAGLKFKEQALLDKQKRLAGMQGDGIEDAKARTADYLVQVRKAIKELK